MELTLKAFAKSEKSTISKLYVDGVYQCDILEDTVRPVGQLKIFGKTAIPAGKYQVIVTMSNRFKRLLPLLVNVPGYEGIRIHPGNSAIDTEGCLLPGTYSESTKDWVSGSVIAFNKLFAKISTTIALKQKIWITIIR